MYAHTQTFFSKEHGRSIVLHCILPKFSEEHFYFHYAFRDKPQTLAHMSDSLVRVTRRDDESYFVQVPPSHYRISFPTTKRKINNQIHTCTYPHTNFHRFLFNNFRYYFTLFSKFFSSFPHGTCLLSVFHKYLALDGIYHPIRAAIPNNSTRRYNFGPDFVTIHTGLSPSTAPLSRGLHCYIQ